MIIGEYSVGVAVGGGISSSVVVLDDGSLTGGTSHLNVKKLQREQSQHSIFQYVHHLYCTSSVDDYKSFKVSK